MKFTFSILLSLIGYSVISQPNNCSCVIKTDKVTLDWKLTLNSIKAKAPAEAPKPYIYLYPENNNEYSTHTVIKDSANIWLIKPHVKSANKYDIIKINKISTTFYVTLYFNSADSIPVYADANTKSKIIHYIKPDPSKKENKLWFVACKEGFAKVLLLEKQSQTGWIKKEYYTHD